MCTFILKIYILPVPVPEIANSLARYQNSFEIVHFDVKSFWISNASLWNSTTIISQAHIMLAAYRPKNSGAIMIQPILSVNWN